MVLQQDIATLQERTVQLAARAQALHGDLQIVRAEREGLHDDLRRLIGLKPRLPQAAPASVSDVPLAPLPSGSMNKQIKLKETPRDHLARMQREHEQRAKLEDQDAVRRAIEGMEPLLF